VSRYRTTITTAAALAATAVLALGRPAAASEVTLTPPPQPATQIVTVERPQGQIVMSDLSVSADGRLQLTVTDTRAEDPGWSVLVTVASDGSHTNLGWKPAVLDHTQAFSDGDGTVYAQQVMTGPAISSGANGEAGIDNAVLGSAPRHHGLGIAVLDANLTAVGHLGGALTVTMTVV
jgi:hypothetical protein